MTMVIDIGLERFYYGEPAAHLAALRHLVGGGLSGLVRDIFDEKGGVTGHAHAARVYEVRRFRGKLQERWLSEEEAAPILGDVRKLPYASFAWHEFDEISPWGEFISRLAMKLADKRDGRPVPVTLPRYERPIRVMDISDSLRLNWTHCPHPQGRIANRIHRVARKHQLIVHSA